MLIALGGFLLVAGLVALVWAPGVVKKTPLDVDSVTHLSGVGGKVDLASGEIDSGPVRASSITKADTDASDDETAVFVNHSCLMKDEGEVPDCLDGDDERLLSASTSLFATDRETALSVDNGDYLPEDAEQPEGLQNKWPFDAEKKDYPYWDGVAGKAVDAVYDRTAEVRGLETYVYHVVVDEAPIEVAEGVEGTYSSDKEIYIDPVTGAIIHQTDSQQRYIDGGPQALELELAFTEEQQKTNVDDAKSNQRTLSLVTVWVPIVGIFGGLLALLVGALLLRTGRRTETA
ncbi:DUF3068 domain-containing protein [Nocardioides sp. cx-169]|uniref:DUF3068 domain-containing protein n=1 Tax=Nocardioides sp. cx-169 TaxID=2899080 RepID=UPI001E3B4F7C|nr:DUF3068 domain-containing protein [Nocardioides sp. cx-169]MCD4534830.1 DUF3068 domain-containing protein [Nocardioides sp. cx-169]